MFKKPDSETWQSGIKMMSRLFGFDDDQEQYSHHQQHRQKQKISNSIPFSPSIMQQQTNSNPPSSLHTPQYHCQKNNQSYVVTNNYSYNSIPCPNNQSKKFVTAITPKLKHSSSSKNSKIKSKWKHLMKSPAHKCKSEIINLLQNGGSVMEEQVWMWLMGNTQKITTQLYNLKKEKFHAIAYNNGSRLQDEGNEATTNMDFPFNYSQHQIQDFTKFPEIRSLIVENDQQKQKQKNFRKNSQNNEEPAVGINDRNTFRQQGHGQRQLQYFQCDEHEQVATGRYSFNSQASTFSSQTNNPQSYNIALSSSPYGSNGSNGRPLAQNSSRSSSVSNHWPLKSMNYANSEHEIPACHPFEQQLQQSSEQQKMLENEDLTVLLQKLPSIVPHNTLCDILGSFLLQREDIPYSVTLFNAAATFYYYTDSNEIKTFILLNHFVATEVYPFYLTGINRANFEGLLQHIVSGIYKNCPSAVFLKRFKLESFIETWLYSFFYSVCENGSQFKNQIFGFLLMEQFSLSSITKLCEAIIISMSRTINQGIDQRTFECLQNPRHFIDFELLQGHLFCQFQ